jgi:hypothetical protein
VGGPLSIAHISQSSAVHISMPHRPCERWYPRHTDQVINSPPNRGNSIVLLGAVTLGVFWAIGRANLVHVQPPVAGLLLIGVLVGTAVMRGWPLAPWATLVYSVLVGMADRIGRSAHIFSDVMAVTQEAIGVLARGQNPYTHLFESTRPPSLGFAYLPGEVAFYAIPNAIVGHVVGTDRWAGIGIVLLLAALAPCVGPARASLATALYATFGEAAFRSLDGSNDTGLAFLVVLAVVLLAWSERPDRGSHTLFYASAAAFAWALLFKEFAWLIYPSVVMYLRRRGADWRSYVAISLGLVVVVILPFFLWAPSRFIHSGLGVVSYHQGVWGLNLWAALARFAPGPVHTITPLIQILALAAVAAVGLAMLTRPASNLGVALFQGLGLLFVLFFLLRWTTSPYYTFAGAVLAAAVALLPLPFSDLGEDAEHTAETARHPYQPPPQAGARLPHRPVFFRRMRP